MRGTGDGVQVTGNGDGLAERTDMSGPGEQKDGGDGERSGGGEDYMGPRKRGIKVQMGDTVVFEPAAPAGVVVVIGDIYMRRGVLQVNDGEGIGGREMVEP